MMNNNAQNLIVLISCMHEKDASIIQRTNVQSDVVVVNQCDHSKIEEFDFVNKYGITCHAKFICTTERGLSKSRNMAIKNSWGDVCLICDNDEVLVDNYPEIILKAYGKYTNAGIITFAMKVNKREVQYKNKTGRLGFKDILRTSSQQITFSRNLIIDYGILFDEKMGSGTGNGGGEENMFMLTVKRHGLELFYYSDFITTVIPAESSWFNGYDKKFFENQGWVDRRILGPIIGLIYLIYWPIFKRNIYVKDGVSVFQAIRSSLKGYFSKR